MDSAEVGANLRDHLAAPLVLGAREGSLYPATKPRALLEYLLRHNGMLTSNIGEAYGFVSSDPLLGAPDLEVALLERSAPRRCFRRLPDAEVASLLGSGS